MYVPKQLQGHGDRKYRLLRDLLRSNHAGPARTRRPRGGSRVPRWLRVALLAAYGVVALPLILGILLATVVLAGPFVLFMVLLLT